MLSFGVARPCEVGRSTIGLVEVTAAHRAAATLRRGGLSSVMRVAHDSSFCGRSQGGRAADAEGDFASAEARRGLSDRPRHPFGPPLISLYQMKRWQVAAALSAAVTSNNWQGTAPTFQAEPTMQKRPTQTPAALREGARGRGFFQRSRLPRTSSFFSVGRSRRLCQPP